MRPDLRLALLLPFALLPLAGACSHHPAPAESAAAAPSDTDPAPLDMKESAFDSNRWNGANGLGGGAGSAFGGRARAAGEPAGTESFARIDESGFVAAADQPLSTFAADVDTASFAIVRRFLRDGSLPPADAVRVEEFVNAQQYATAAPRDGEQFAIEQELGRCPWQPDHLLLRVGLRTRPIDVARLPPCNLVFLIDVSGSMDQPDKLPLLQRSLALLVDQLRPQDSVAIVTYAAGVALALPPTAGSERDRILETLHGLRGGGATNAEGGIDLAYRTAFGQYRVEAQNRVILATDGDFNVGIRDPSELERFIAERKDRGVFLNVLGFGTGNLRDDRLERLANRGNGTYSYIDDLAEGRRVLVAQLGAELVTVAKDTKLQLEFDPAAVRRYRQIGYENRKLRADEFRDDGKDAGELGAGHALTVLYELELQPGAAGDRLGALRIRHKAPLSGTAAERSVPLTPHGGAQDSRDQRVAATAAAFGMLLRGSAHAGTFGWVDLQRYTADLEVPVLGELIGRAAQLAAAAQR